MEKLLLLAIFNLFQGFARIAQSQVINYRNSGMCIQCSFLEIAK